MRDTTRSLAQLWLLTVSDVSRLARRAKKRDTTGYNGLPVPRWAFLYFPPSGLKWTPVDKPPDVAKDFETFPERRCL